MSVCIFVQIVESPALVAMLTMLSRGLNDKVEVVTRTCCLIVDNICKIVEYIAVVIPIMPELGLVVKTNAREALQPRGKEHGGESFDAPASMATFQGVA